jgi:hypothetical protein
VSSQKVLAALAPPTGVEPVEKPTRPRREAREARIPEDAEGSGSGSGSGSALVEVTTVRKEVEAKPAELKTRRIKVKPIVATKTNAMAKAPLSKLGKLRKVQAKAIAVGGRAKRVQAVVKQVIKRRVRPIKGMLLPEQTEAPGPLPAALESSRPKFWRSDAKGKDKDKEPSLQKKDYMTSGLYCQNATAESPHKLINKVLDRRQAELKQLRAAAKGKSRARSPPTTNGPSFPPLPYDHGYQHFFGQEHEFKLPYNIQYEAESGALDGKKKPSPYQKIRGSESRTLPRLPPSPASPARISHATQMSSPRGPASCLTTRRYVIARLPRCAERGVSTG